MEIEIKKKSKKNSKKVNRNPAKGGRKASRKNRKQSSRLQAHLVGPVDSSTTRDFVHALLAPDIYGPIRIPRSGASQRTGLAIDRSFTTLGSTTSFNNFVMTSGYANVGNFYTAVNAGAAWVFGSGLSPGTQFPTAAQMADIDIVALSLVVTYIGAPLNATGEIVLGTVPENLALNVTSSFNSLAFMPGALRVPVSSLIKEPLRISGKKVSPVADEFVAPTVTNVDLEVPFICCSTLASLGALQLTLTRTYEYRTTQASGSVIPYARATETFSMDLGMYENAQGLIGEQPTLVQEGYPEMLLNAATEMFGQASSGVRTAAIRGGSTMVQYLANNYVNQLTRSFGGGSGTMI